MKSQVGLGTALLFTMVAAAAAQAPTAGPAPSRSPVIGDVFTDPSAVIPAHVGQTFLIALDANRTTGYAWQAAAVGAPFVEIVGSAYDAPDTSRLGAGGRELFILRAAASGIASLTFRYIRPFDKASGDGAKSVTFQIEIAP